MRSSDAAIEIIPPESEGRVHLSALPTAFAYSMVRGVETVSEERGSDEAPRQRSGTDDNNGDMHALRHHSLVKTAVLGEWIQLTPEERQKWTKLNEESSDVLNKKGLMAGRPPAGRSLHRIKLPGSAPSFVPRDRRAQHLEEESERQADELLKRGKVQPSPSVFGHNPVLAKKKDGRWRMCIDFKPLNKITAKQNFPMPRVEEILDRLQGSAVYSAVEFVVAFLQIPIHPEDRHKTAFHTRTRKPEYTCMPFRLVNAPAKLQGQVNHDFLGTIAEGWMVIYIDDVLVFSRNVHEQLQHLGRALQLIREKQWFVQAQFATPWVGPFAVRSRVNALAYIIDLPSTWRCHHSINVGFINSFGNPRGFLARVRGNRVYSRNCFFNDPAGFSASRTQIFSRRGLTPAEAMGGR
ncbi:uncharacterized protein EMH_0003480 [Eimeria mitis]|uniref:Reverse transcriptase domain-containing protein n=1 Tax=Eimeria mitis TaxID=44415 RepID=U6JYZ6_9EIME|nr:uncharacterized protein EMH_0003480 [Eimeria mitis]CDJ29277.1 hypothetical protein EMH_0003480 [Eimeria mitis]